MGPFKRMMVAIVAGLLAAFFTAAFALSITANARSQTAKLLEGYGETISIVVPSQAIPAGTVIQESMVHVVDWPRALTPPAVVTEVEALLGKSAVDSLYPAEPIVSDRVGDKGAAGLISVPEGMYAASIPISDTRAVGGAISVGRYVRIVVTDSTGSTGTVAERVLVLATSNSADTGSRGEGGFLAPTTSSGGLAWVTLALPDDLLEPVIQSSDVGIVHLVLVE